MPVTESLHFTGAGERHPVRIIAVLKEDEQKILKMLLWDGQGVLIVRVTHEFLHPGRVFSRSLTFCIGHHLMARFALRLYFTFSDASCMQALTLMLV